MKKFFISALLAVTVATSAFAADIPTVTAAAIMSFNSSFNGASDVSWSKVGDYAKASFIMNNERVEAYYNVDGEMIGSAKGISIESLPVSAKRTFAKKFNGYTVTEAIKFEGQEETAYYISANNGKESVILKVGADESLARYSKSSK